MAGEPAPPGFVEVEIHQLDCRRPDDTWCAPCAMPSVWEVDWAYVDTATLRMIGRSTTRWCIDCGRVEQQAVRGSG